MFCPQCGHQNLPEAKFCLECGAAIKTAPEGSTSHETTAPGVTPAAAADAPKAPAGESVSGDAQKSQPVSAGKESASDKPSGSSSPPPPSQARKPVGTGIWLYLGLGCLGIILLTVIFIIGIVVVGKKLVADKTGRVTVTATPGDSQGKLTPTPHPVATGVFRDAIMCKSLTSNMSPEEKSDVFTPHDTFYCSVHVKGIKVGQVVTAKWYKGETFIKEYPFTINISKAVYIGFSLKPKTQWPAGDDYKVEIFVDDELAGEASFRVGEGGDNSSSETEMDPALKDCLKSATLCKNVDENYKPIDETEVFGKNDTFNCLVIVENTPADTKVKAKWYYGETLLQEKEVPLTDGGSKTLNLYCRKKTGWAPGDYSVELSLNNHPLEVKKFTVVEEEGSGGGGEEE